MHAAILERFRSLYGIIALKILGASKFEPYKCRALDGTTQTSRNYYFCFTRTSEFGERIVLKNQRNLRPKEGK